MKTWVIVASAARARIFEEAGRTKPWDEVMDLVNSDGRLLRQDMISDKPGRVVDGARGQHHTMDPAADPKEEAARSFARELAEELKSALNDRRCEQLILVAPPHFLGLLREQADDRLARAVKAEITKDLTREDAASLRAHVAELL